MNNLLSYLLPHGSHWAIEEGAARQLAAILEATTPEQHRLDVAERVGQMRAEIEAAGGPQAAKPGDRDYTMSGGIAYLDLQGAMTKNRTSMGSGCSTAYLRRQVEAAAKDPEVKGIFMRIDSPGGSVAGTDDLARAVADVARSKPVYAYIEDMGASAAYWVASQATRVYANPTALVGSLGTYSVVTDYSRSAENMGIKVHVLSTGKYKGAGVPGAKITDEQIEQMQGTVDDLNDSFVAAVARGRMMTKADTRKLFDGAVHTSVKAKSMGLIDEISTMNTAVAGLQREISAGVRADDRLTFEAVASEEEHFLSDGEEPTRNGRSLSDQTTALLADAEALTSRLSRLRDARRAEGRDLGPKAIQHINDTADALRSTAEALLELRPAPKMSEDLTRELALAAAALSE